MIRGLKVEVIAVNHRLSKEEGLLLKRYISRMSGWLRFRDVRDESVLEKYLSGCGGQTVLMDEGGELLSSEQAASRVRNARELWGVREMRFIIGPADGVSDSLRKRPDWMWSFGRVTWPHNLMQILVAEQLYRVSCILDGHPYHRE